MNKLKLAGLASVAASLGTSEEWLLVISILLTVLGMLQDYLKNKD